MDGVEPHSLQHFGERRRMSKKKFLKAVIMCLALIFSSMCFSHIGSFFPPVGILEMCLGFAISAGPTYGGILYDYFGFEAPFIGLFVALLMLWIPAYFVMKKSSNFEQNEDDRDDLTEGEPITWRKLIKVPRVFFAGFCATISMIAVTSLEVSLSLHVIEKFHVSPAISGLLMFIAPGIYALSSPLVGYIIDKKDCPAILIGIGSTAFAIGFLLLGPVPFFHIKQSLWLLCFSLTLIGFGISLTYVPSIGLGYQVLRSEGIRLDMKANAFISNFILFSGNLGYVIGPLTSGYIMQAVGFEWSSLVYSSLSASVAICLIIYTIVMRIRKKCTVLPDDRTVLINNETIQYRSI
ncbi:MFS-type transporter SLC18B1 [Nymphon striatum]|nr:MFS-type transporter SLC18B1 [Nymphon striatum]